MKKIYLLFWILLGSLYFAQTFETIPLIENGPREKRIKLVIMGDGYTSSELNTFTQDATKVANYLFTKAPYANYKNYFNVYLVKVISSESGIKHPGNANDENEENPPVPISNPNNALETSFDQGGVHRCIYSNNINKVGQVLANNFPDFDIALIIGNTTYYGGCGGEYPFITRHTESHDVAAHELGHTFGNLADEYWVDNQGELPNKTQNADPATIKWKNWVGSRGVGIYPFDEAPNWYRPHQNCEMRNLNSEFCSVCKETLIEKIHKSLSPIESYTPDNAEAVAVADQIDFNVKLILPIPNTLSSKWLLNGVEMSGSLDAITLQKNQLQDGNNTLVFNVEDKTTDVRVDGHETLHISTIKWNIKKTNLGVDDITSQSLDFQVYPNPTQNMIYLDIKQKVGNNIFAEVLDLSGRQAISKKKLNPKNKYAIDLKPLTNQVYILKVYEGSTLLFVRKIIKN